MTHSNILIDFKDLPKNTFVKLNDVNEIISKLKEKYLMWKDIGKMLKTPPSNIHRIERTGFINLEMLYKILDDLSISFEDIMSKIVAIKIGDRGTPITNILPLYASPELASLLAHTMGDGGIHNKSCRFEYNNSRKEVVDDVLKSVSKVFKFDTPYIVRYQKTNTVVTRLLYPNIIGYILHLLGAARGNKVRTTFLIPKWIMSGSADIKKYFLQSLFDDDGSVEKNFLISLSLDKKYPYENNLLDFFKQIEKLLSEFGISHVNITLRKKEAGVKGVLRISNLLQLEKFSENINFIHEKRKERLISLLKTERRVYRRGGGTEEAILNCLKDNPFSTIEISKKIKRCRSNTNRFLLKMEKKKLAKRLRKEDYNIIWTLPQ